MDNKKTVKQKKSRRPYRRYTMSIGDILQAKADAGDEDARQAAAKLIHKRRSNYKK